MTKNHTGGVAQGSFRQAKDYVDNAIASFAFDPPDNQYLKGYLAALEVVQAEAFTGAQPPAAPVDMGTAMEVYDHAYCLVLQKSGDPRKAKIAGVSAAINAAYDVMTPPVLPSSAATEDARPVWQQLQLGLLLGMLSDWRNADHEDSIRLSRSDVIAIIEGFKARPPTEPQAVPETQSAAALTERLIQAAVDYESGRCSKREMAEARAAVEEAIK